MGGVISYGNSDEATWLAAGWAFRRFLADVLATSADDTEFAYAVQQAEALQGLCLDSVAEDNPELASKLIHAMKDVALATIEDAPGRPLNWRQGLDVAGQAMYLVSVAECCFCVTAAS